MRFTVLKTLAATAFIGLGFASSANATPVTHQISAVVDASFFVTPPNNPNDLKIYTHTTYSGFPFTIGEGDTIEFDVTTTNGGITLTNAGPGLSEFLGVFNLATNSGYTPPGNMILPTSPTVLTYDFSSTATVLNATGDLANSSVTFSATGAQQKAPIFTVPNLGNYTNSTVTLYDFVIATTFTNITYQPGYEYLAAYNTILGNNALLIAGDQIATPAPWSLALLGLGLIGMGAVRRRKIAA